MADQLKYEKTDDDISREARDLLHNPAVRFIKHQESFRFNIGDILVMQYKYGDEEWLTKRAGPTETPVKYMYVFENEVGVGYIKKLRSNGKGFTTMTTCLADLDPTTTRLILDPEYVDHILLSSGEEYDYSRMHAEKSSFRKAAIEKNKKLLVDMSTPQARVDYFYSLKVGDIVWMGTCWDDIVNDVRTVVDIQDIPISELAKAKLGYNSPNVETVKASAEGRLIKNYRIVVLKTQEGWDRNYSILELHGYKFLKSKPWPLKDEGV
jgi:hypothetical protein